MSRPLVSCLFGKIKLFKKNFRCVLGLINIHQRSYNVNTVNSLLTELPVLNALSSKKFSSKSPNSDRKTSLVIFDKDGTLICFHAMWAPWAMCLAETVHEDSNHPVANIAQEIYDLLGFCPITKVVKSGMLAENTMVQIKNSIIDLIMQHGLPADTATTIVENAFEQCDTSNRLDTLQPLDDLHALFQTLKENNIKIAVCTADSRNQTETTLRRLGLIKYIDMVVCGDDFGTKPKPDPHNALKICKTLQVAPEEALMIGDTPTDVRFGKSAKLGITVGVLSGIGRPEELMEKGADCLVQKVGDILPLVLKHNAHKIQGATSVLNRLKLFFARNWNNNNIQNIQPSNSHGTVFGRSTEFPHIKPSQNLDNGQKRFYNKFVPDGVRPTHIIVGAGSAGCVLANRLTENKNNKVLLMEAGPQDAKWNWKIHMPSALTYNLGDDRYNWYYHTIAQLHMNERVMYWPRGRVWGGSSALNAMVYIRGHARDYDRWVTEGADGWSYAECLPYFKKSETFSEGGDQYRGDSGPLHVTRIRSGIPLYDAFVEAAVQAGYTKTQDMNGYKQEGFGPMDATIYKGKRWSTSQAYLHPILSRSNLFIESNAMATKIILDKNRAIGVEAQYFTQKVAHGVEKASLRKRHYCESKVILCGGAINSPQLLMLSGIGHSAVLKAVEVPLVHNLPGVGCNLQDHLEVYVQHACTQPITLYDKSSWKYPHNMIRIGLEWMLYHTGVGASNHLETGGFVRTDPSVEHPNIQFHFLPSQVIDHGRKLGDRHAYQVHVGTMRATSRGWVKLRSNDPFTPPVINPNYLDTEVDRKEMRESVRIARRIFAQKAFDPYRGAELSPGADVITDSQIDAFVRANGDSAYHPSCTCKMGPEGDPLTVVNPKSLLVHGSENLHVVDASIMPSVVSGNLNGPVIMMAEKAADIIEGKPPLPPENAPVWKPPN